MKTIKVELNELEIVALIGSISVRLAKMSEAESKKEQLGAIAKRLEVSLNVLCNTATHNCDTCKDDVSINCHDCEQYQQFDADIAEATAEANALCEKFYIDDLRYIQEVEEGLGYDIESRSQTEKLVYELNAEGKSPGYAVELIRPQ